MAEACGTINDKSTAADDGFNVSPALVEGDIYLRGYKSLYGIGAQ